METSLLTLRSIILSTIFLGGTFSAQADIETTYTGVPEEAQEDFEAAADIWDACLATELPIKIHVTWIERGPTGFAYQNVTRNEEVLPVKDAWYPSALANELRGHRIDDTDDINIFLSGRTNWYYDSETPIGEDQTDFINVAVHEIAHGLGISSATFIPWQGDPIATIGQPNDFVNYFDYTFDLHDQDGTPLVYDTFIRLADGRGLLDFQNGSLELTKALANPTLHFAGTKARELNGGYPVGVTPLSISHIPAFPRSPNPIMLSDSGQGESIRQPDAILLGMLADLGWPIEESCLPG